MKEELIELMKEKGFYNYDSQIIELEECDVEIMAESIIKLYDSHIVSGSALTALEELYIKYAADKLDKDTLG